MEMEELIKDRLGWNLEDYLYEHGWGIILNGEKEGYYLTYDFEGHYRKGKYDGKMLYYHHNGIIENECYYVNERAVGPYLGWFNNGQKRVEGQYKDDKRDGTWKYWKIDGTFYLERIHRNGLIISERIIE